MINKFLRGVRRWLSGPHSNSRRPFELHRIIFERSELSAVLFYAVSMFLALDTSSWIYRQYSVFGFAEPLWPFFAMAPGQHPLVLEVILAAWCFGAFAATFLFRSRWPKIVHGLAVFYLVALINSDGHFAHNFHALLFISIILAFLPSPARRAADERARRHLFVLVFWSTQFVICTFYFLSGVWKVRSLVACAVLPNLKCELTEKVLTNIAAQELISFNEFAPFHQILFVMPWLGFVSYMGTIWLHLISMYIPFRPRLHVVFGVVRTVFHLGTLVLFGVNFSMMTAAVATIFVFSPFQLRDRPILEELVEFPPFGFFRRWLKRDRNLERSQFELRRTDLMRVGYALFMISVCMQSGWVWRDAYARVHPGWLVHLAFTSILAASLLATTRPGQLVFRVWTAVSMIAVAYITKDFAGWLFPLPLQLVVLGLVALPYLSERIFDRGLYAFGILAAVTSVGLVLDNLYDVRLRYDSWLWPVIFVPALLFGGLTIYFAVRVRESWIHSSRAFACLAILLLVQLVSGGFAFSSVLLAAIPVFLYYPNRLRWDVA